MCVNKLLAVYLESGGRYFPVPTKMRGQFIWQLRKSRTI
jgi:hypothetical protein